MSGQSLITVYMKYPEMEPVAGVNSFAVILTEIKFQFGW